MHLHLINHINLRITLPKGEEIFVLSNRIIPITNDNDSLQNPLLSSFIQTPLEKQIAPPFSCRIVSIASSVRYGVLHPLGRLGVSPPP